MNIKFTVDDSEDYYTLTKSDHYGFNLSHFRKSKNADAKKPYSQHTLFYATLQQAAEKIVYLNLKGNDVQEVVDSVVALSDTLAKTLEKL